MNIDTSTWVDLHFLVAVGWILGALLIATRNTIHLPRKVRLTLGGRAVCSILAASLLVIVGAWIGQPRDHAAMKLVLMATAAAMWLYWVATPRLRYDPNAQHQDTAL